MAAAVPQADTPPQFLFTAVPGSALITGFKISSDGSLAPVPGSPFIIAAPARAVTSAHDVLIVATENILSAYSVDKETGVIQQTDSVPTGPISRLATGHSSNSAYAVTQTGMRAFQVSKGKLEELPAAIAAADFSSSATPASPPAVLDATGRFMYVVDADKAELAAYRMDGGKLIALSPPSYPTFRGTTFVTLVKP